MWNEQIAGGNRSRVSYVPATGNLVVAPSDGAVRLLDKDFNTLAKTEYGVEPEYLMAVGKWVMLSSTDVGTVLCDGRDLVVRDRIGPIQIPVNAFTVRLDIDDNQLIAVDIKEMDTGKGARAVSRATPGVR